MQRLIVPGGKINVVILREVKLPIMKFSDHLVDLENNLGLIYQNTALFDNSTKIHISKSLQSK